MKPGTRLGPYEIQEQLGVGGMGEVYLAEDTRLSRKVAIKVLPEPYAGDPERLARFEQEARAAAALNHPHIAVVHDVGAEEIDGASVHFMVQEHLEGQSGKEALRDGALPLGRALQLATEIAEALTVAHGAGIVHRDLKPANVFVTSEGHAKVLDFGLAKLLAPAGPDDPEVSGSPTALGTVAGQVMGTAGYMAPEQVAGEAVDHRADIFAFGCLLYEMTTGDQAFRAATVLDTLHALVHDEPRPLQEVNSHLPAELRRIVRKCLAKQADARYQSAAELAADLRALAAEVEAGTAVPLGAAAGAALGAEQSGVPMAPALAAAVLAMVAIVAGGAGWLLRAPQSAPEPSKHFEIELETGRSPDIPVIAPDGSFIVYEEGSSDGSTARLAIRRLDSTSSTVIPGTERANDVFVSPDSRWIGFSANAAVSSTAPADWKMFKVSLAGGEPFELCDCNGTAAWGDDGNIYYSREGAIWTVPEGGGDPREILAAEDGYFWRPFAVAGTRVLLLQRSASETSHGIVALTLDDGVVHTLIEDGVDPFYAQTGHLVYGRGGTLYAVPFEPGTLELTGEPTPIVQGVRMTALGRMAASVSDDGTLVYRRETGEPDVAPERRIVWVDREGTEEPATERRGYYSAVRLAPDGRSLAVEVNRGSALRPQLWLLGLQDDTFAPLHPPEDNSQAPLWSPSGRRIYYAVQEEGGAAGVYFRASDFSGEPELLLQTDGRVFPISWADDEGDQLVMHEMIEGAQRRRILEKRIGDDASPSSFLDPSGQFNMRSPMVSPDRQWIAYVSTETGRDEVFVRPYPEGGARVQVSNEGGVSPMWGRDRSELFYRQAVAPFRSDSSPMMAARLDPGASMRVVDRQELFSGDYYLQGNAARPVYDYDPEADRFLMVPMARPTDDNPEPEYRLDVIVDWFDHLRAQVPGDR